MLNGILLRLNIVDENSLKTVFFADDGGGWGAIWSEVGEV